MSIKESSLTRLKTLEKRKEKKGILGKKLNWISETIIRTGFLKSRYNTNE